MPLAAPKADERGPFSLRRDDDARLALLVLAALEMFIVRPLVDLGYLGEFHSALVYGCTLFLGVLAVGHRRSFRVIAFAVASLAALAHALLLGFPSLGSRIADAVLAMTTAGTFAAFVLAYVLGKGRVTIHRVVGAVVAYLLIGMMWARTYHILVLLRPEALSLPTGESDFSHLVYFSFATLTTLGYGNPVHPVARSLAMVEALAGQLYPAILIARLVSLQIAPAETRDG